MKKKKFKLTDGVTHNPSFKGLIKDDVFTGDVNTVMIQAKDSKGNMYQITDSNKPSTSPGELIVKVEATHSGVNKNYGNYLPDKMEASAHTWLKDFAKPVLLNHNSYDGDPIGRVIAFDFKRSALDAEKHTIELTLRVTNQDAIERFLDGRYQTFSIGAYTDSITCSICGKDILNDGFCGHWRGDKYQVKKEGTDVSVTETCIWTFGNFEYDEISVVNSPADTLAVAMSIEVPGDDAKTKQLNSKPESNDSADDAGTDAGTGDSADGDTDDNVNSLLHVVDKNLNLGDNKTEDNTGDGQEGEANTQDSKETPENTTADGQAGENVSDSNLPTEDVAIDYSTLKFENLQGVIDFMRTRITACESVTTDNTKEPMYQVFKVMLDCLSSHASEHDNIQTQLTDMKTQKEALDLAFAENQAALDALKIENTALTEQNLGLARLVQSSYIDHLATIRSVGKPGTNKDSIKDELKKSSTTELAQAILKESKTLATAFRPKQLENPGLSDSNGSDAEDFGGKQRRRSSVEQAEELLRDGVDFLLNPSARAED